MVHYLVTALIDFFVGFAALTKTRNKSAIALAFTAFSLGLWSLELFLLTVIDDLVSLSFWFHLTRWGMFFIPPSLALLAWRLVGSRSKRYLALVLVPGVALSAGLAIANLFFFPSKLEGVTGGFLPKVDAIFYVFAINFLWCLVGAVTLCIGCYKSATHRERQRIRWLMIILVMTMSTGLMSIWLVKYDFYLKLVGATTNIVFISLLFYATVQHHLMDIRLALSVGLTRLAVLALVVWSYFFLHSVVGELDQSIAGVLVMLIFIVVVLEMYPRVLRWALPNAIKLMTRHGYDFEQVKEATRAELNVCMNLKGLNRVLEFLMVHTVRANSYQFWKIENGAIHSVSLSKSLKGETLTSDQKNELLHYCQENKGLVIADETPERIQRIAARCDCNAFFSVEYENDLVALILVGCTSELSFYRFDDIRIFEWLRQELGQVLNRIKRLDEMQDELGDAKKTLSMLGVMNHYHHDIKAPLAIIDGVLTNNIYDRERQTQIVLEQVDRSSKLIATMAQILRGQRKRKLQAVSIRDTIEDSLFLFAQRLDKLDKQFSDTPKITADPEDLKILVINVVKNAIEAKREGVPLTMSIRTWTTADYVCVAFSDNGMGIPQNMLENIWENAETTKQYGSGIGLQAIKRIADEHQAIIEVNSKVDEGTRFIIKFPMSLVVTNVPEPEFNEDNIFARKNRKLDPSLIRNS